MFLRGGYSSCCSKTSFNNAVAVGRRCFSVTTSKCSAANTDTPDPTPVQRETLRMKFRKARKESTFKYWVIGGTAFVSWMGYYGLKSYKNSRVEVDIPPTLPGHVTVTRLGDIAQLFDKHEGQYSLFGGEKIKKILIAGGSASGKTILAHDFASFLVANLTTLQYGIPASKIKVFLQGETEQSFLLSLKAFAAKMKVKPSELDDAINSSFRSASWDDKCRALLVCIQESVKKHPDWVIVIDNVQLTTPPSVVKVINEWFLTNENEAGWSRGSICIVQDGMKRGRFAIPEEHRFVNHGFSQGDAYRLIQEYVNIDRKLPLRPSFTQLLDKFECNPLAAVCAAMLLRDKLSEKEIVSLDSALNDLCKEIDTELEKVCHDNRYLADYIRTNAGSKLVAIETLVAMAMKSVLSKDRYLWHGFDMLATLKPGAAIPQSLLTRHLRNPVYKLPPLVQPGMGGCGIDFNQQKNDAIVQKAAENEPKGKWWSNKNLSEYLIKAEEFFNTGMSTVKEIYNLLYGELPPLPEKPDGLDMFRECELLQTGLIEPGGTKAITMHPMVYSVARQYFLATTIPITENEYINEQEAQYLGQSWYKKLNKFSEQACLHTLRTSVGHPLTSQVDEDHVTPLLSRYNHGINVSSVFSYHPFVDKTEDFWTLQNTDRYRYLQSHVTRVSTSLRDDIAVAKNDVTGRSVKNYLLAHLEYMLNNHPAELFGINGHVAGLQTIATCYSDLNDDVTESKTILENTLTVQRSTATTDPLDIAETLAKLASIRQKHEDFSGAKELLEEAGELHEADRRKLGEYRNCLEFGRLLGQLGVVYAALSMKKESKEAIERSLMLKQVKPPDLLDEPKSKEYGADFSSSLTDLGHAYVSMGMPLYGKKILDLALAAQKNILGEEHPEVVRTLTILAVAHLMQGNNKESKKLRNEAGKLQSQINALPLY